MAYQCLIDSKRAFAFRQAIQKAIRPGDVVVDLGSGTGILSMFAAEAGAGRVYAIEADNNIFGALEKNIKFSNFSQKIILVNADACSVKLPEKVDVVICEMIATGLIDELQIPVMNHIHQYCKEDTKFIPGSISSFIELVTMNNTFYGHRMQVVQYEYEWEKSFRSQPLSAKIPYSTVDFSKRNEVSVSGQFNLPINKRGSINGIKISNMTHFPDGSTFGHSAAYCMPLILPVAELNVSEGDEISISIEYEMCKGLDGLSYSINKLG